FEKSPEGEAYGTLGARVPAVEDLCRGAPDEPAPAVVEPAADRRRADVECERERTLRVRVVHGLYGIGTAGIDRSFFGLKASCRGLSRPTLTLTNKPSSPTVTVALQNLAGCVAPAIPSRWTDGS